MVPLFRWILDRSEAQAEVIFESEALPGPPLSPRESQISMVPRTVLFFCRAHRFTRLMFSISANDSATSPGSGLIAAFFAARLGCEHRQRFHLATA